MLNDWIDIKTKDELPEEFYPVLLWLEDGCTVGYRDKDIWRDIFLSPIEKEVVAWRPFPFGPKGEVLVSSIIKYEHEPVWRECWCVEK